MLYGRDVERAEIGALLDRARSSKGGALVVRGEPGIGKTALLEDARDRAADMHVLSVRGVESEAELAFAGLHQLLRPALHLLPRLPLPQANALQAAFGLEEGTAQEHFLVFAACLSLLSELSDRRPLLCLIDDAHWLDTVSADALLFAARRLDAEGIVMLFGARDGDVRTFEARDLPSLRLEGLDAEAVEQLLARGAGRSAAAAVRDHIAALTGGNALALLELPRGLTDAQLAGVEPLPDALPVTEQVESLFLARVRRLPEESQRLLLVAAADNSGSLTVVTRAAEAIGVSAEALAEAEEAGLVSVMGTQIGFRHPLVRSALYSAATSVERRNAHRALSDALVDDSAHADRRAWHLAASAVEHDEETVKALEGAAERAEARGGYLAAAKALARAAELSDDPPNRGRLLVRAARAARIAGVDNYAVELATTASPQVTDPVLGAEIALVQGVAAFRIGRPADGLPTLLESARAVETLDPARATELLVWAMPCAVSSGHQVAAADIAAIAEQILRGGAAPHPQLLHALVTIARATASEPSVRTEELDESIAWATAAEDPLEISTVGVAALYAGVRDASFALLERAAAVARERGEFGQLAESLTMRAFQLAVAQRLDDAAIAAEESSQFARELRMTNLAARSLAILAYIQAIRGNEDDARRMAGEVIGHAGAQGPSAGLAFALYSLATLELGRANWNDALDQLNVLADAGRHGSIFLAAVSGADRVEAAVHAGRPELAREALERFEAWAERATAEWVRPRLLSSRALLEEGDDATVRFEEALRHADDARPFDLGRIQLLFGEHLRRQRRRVDARTHLRAALETFERFGAEPWAERVRAELRASGEVARKRDPSTISQLTPQEMQVARLVAEGLSNKEAAAQLFLSPRTIDAHLRNVFAKLGLTSRTQLARFPLGGDAERPGASPAPAPA